jgi:hypothetical protein
MGGGTPRRRRLAQYGARAGSSGSELPLTIRCRTMLVQANLVRYAPLSRSPKTHRSRQDLLNAPNYRLITQCIDLFAEPYLAHL